MPLHVSALHSSLHSSPAVQVLHGIFRSLCAACHICYNVLTAAFDSCLASPMGNWDHANSGTCENLLELFGIVNPIHGKDLLEFETAHCI